MRNLDLSKIDDFYVREVFRQLIAYVDNVDGNGGGDTITNNVVQRIPLDGSEQVSGTILPDSTGTHNLGSEDAKFGEVHTQELFVDNNTLYVGGQPALRNENGTVTLSSGENQDVAIKARGTGRVIIDAEADVILNSTGQVTVNGDVISNNNNLTETRAREVFEVTSLLKSTKVITLNLAPNNLSESVYLNGIYMTEGTTHDYTITGNQITFHRNLGRVGGVITINYTFF